MIILRWIFVVSVVAVVLGVVTLIDSVDRLRDWVDGTREHIGRATGRSEKVVPISPAG